MDDKRFEDIIKSRLHDYKDSAYGENGDIDEYKDYLNGKFIILNIEPAPGGGGSLVFIFKNKQYGDQPAKC